jgi:hypothetical protein
MINAELLGQKTHLKTAVRGPSQNYSDSAQLRPLAGHGCNSRMFRPA